MIFIVTVRERDTDRLVRMQNGIQQNQARTDGEMLAAFVSGGDEQAFATVIQRHGRMVAGVAHGILGDWHEAQDVAQAVFLVLARKAGRLQASLSVAPWLHRVAHDVAVDALRRRQSRSRHERDGDLMNLPYTSVKSLESMSGDQRRQLQEQLGRLPDRYRAPLVLCYLEGQTSEQAAQMLGLEAGTLRKRLERGRDRLRQRLARAGWVVTTGTLMTLLSAETGAAVLPASYISATVKACSLVATGKFAAGVGVGIISPNVAALTKGTLHMLFISKLKTAIVVATASVAVVGTGIVTATQQGQSPMAAPVAVTKGQSSISQTPARQTQVQSVAVPAKALVPSSAPDGIWVPIDPGAARVNAGTGTQGQSPAVSVHSVKGQIVSINESRLTLRVSGGQSSDMLCSVGPGTTVILMGGKQGALTDLNASQMVKATLDSQWKQVIKIEIVER